MKAGLFWFIRFIMRTLCFQPNATSRTIMRLNPAAKKTVPILECRPCDR